MYACVAETQQDEPTSMVVDGRTTRVVTNDAMRDHWNDLLPASSFRRWRHSQVAAFGQAPDPADDERHGRQEDPEYPQNGQGRVTTALDDSAAHALIEVEYVDMDKTEKEEAVSRISWVTAMPSCTVETQGASGKWHVPVPDTRPQEWLCIDLAIPAWSSMD